MRGHTIRGDQVQKMDPWYLLGLRLELAERVCLIELAFVGTDTLHLTHHGSRRTRCGRVVLACPMAPDGAGVAGLVRFLEERGERLCRICRRRAERDAANLAVLSQPRR